MQSTDAAMPMSLIGGIPDGDVNRTAVCLRDVTGHLEERIHAIALSVRSVPAKVSEIIAACVASIGGMHVDRTEAAKLCVGDRRLLLLRCAQQYIGDDYWIAPRCTRCDSVFDVRVSRSALPLKPAGRSFPFADVTIRGHAVRCRVPNGADQEIIAELDDDAALLQLLRRCIVSVAGNPPPPGFAENLSVHEVSRLEEALDDVAPDVGTRMDVACPECDCRQEVGLDPYQCELIGAETVYRDVHMIASHYHWREQDVLSLSRERRLMYLRMIEGSMGVHA